MRFHLPGAVRLVYHELLQPRVPGKPAARIKEVRSGHIPAAQWWSWEQSINGKRFTFNNEADKLAASLANSTQDKLRPWFCTTRLATRQSELPHPAVSQVRQCACAHQFVLNICSTRPPLARGRRHSLVSIKDCVDVPMGALKQ
jgi:hypothetical protein